MARLGVVRKAVRIEASGDDAHAMGDVADLIAGHTGVGAVLALPDGRTVPLPARLVQAVEAAARELARGHTVTLLPGDAMLTPAEVAELLGLSRPFVVRLLDEGEIPSERLPRSRHRRVRLADVVAFGDRRELRREGRRRINQAVRRAGLPY